MNTILLVQCTVYMFSVAEGDDRGRAMLGDGTKPYILTHASDLREAEVITTSLTSLFIRILNHSTNLQ